MKAAVLYGNEDIRYADWETPVCRPGTVKVRIRATGICGSDVPRVLNHGAHFYPVVLGHEFSGDIVEVGEGVENLSVGDTVSGAPLVPCMKCEDCQLGNFSLCKHYSFIGSREQGSFAEYVVIPAANAIKYDPSIPYDQAAMFEPSTVAIHGLLQARYRGGETAAVLGCGTIGIFTLQWAKIFGAKKIVAFDIDDGRLALAKKMGADETVNTLKEGFMEEAKALTEEWVSVPGTSEHQLGIAVDISGAVYAIYPWLQENAFQYGFILRYPADKTAITGFATEEWHYRYVGVDAATEMHERGLCLEEYLE